MLLKTSKGYTYEVDWIDTVSTGRLHLQMPSNDSMSQIAAEFECLEWLKRESENQGDKLFEGYSNLTMVKQVEPGIVLLTFQKAN